MSKIALTLDLDTALHANLQKLANVRGVDIGGYAVALLRVGADTALRSIQLEQILEMAVASVKAKDAARRKAAKPKPKAKAAKVSPAKAVTIRERRPRQV